MSGDTDIMLKSASARRMLDSISPIYGRARNFLAILDALGGETQQINDWAEQSEPSGNASDRRLGA